jgi:hypothetical protein
LVVKGHARRLAIAAALVLAAAGQARAAQLCGWLTETVKADQVHDFSLWLQSDSDVAFFYKMAGKGIVTGAGSSYSPGSGTYSLRPGRTESPWTYGTNISEGEVDIVAEIHETPKNVFDDAESPLLVTWTFRRHVAEGEKKPPTDFAKHQCITIPNQH